MQPGVKTAARRAVSVASLLRRTPQSTFLLSVLVAAFHSLKAHETFHAPPRSSSSRPLSAALHRAWSSRMSCKTSCAILQALGSHALRRRRRGCSNRAGLASHRSPGAPTAADSVKMGLSGLDSSRLVPGMLYVASGARRDRVSAAACAGDRNSFPHTSSPPHLASL
ncbi:hypothetical protein BD626DRAFT_164750 [Schizophyllum amplum]|uniref:Uncharacterized protein n=1 Tax=Schizophyllum amplum TaxID=97359 RepID=A0A550CPU5_9AGAR|nr:hypothetical protein BD626DRAFT_164750 [Auriculariopsis ampla]